MTAPRFIRYIFLHILFFIAGLIPRDRNIWVFGALGQFGGNSRYVFLFNASGGKVRKIWLARDKNLVILLRSRGLLAHDLCSLAGIYYALRGGVYVYNIFSHYDINYFLSNGARRVNLWHETPVKKGGSDTDLKANYFYKVHHGDIWQKLYYRFFTPWETEKTDMVICTSPRTQEIMRGVFGRRAKEIVITGYPHNDVFMAKQTFLLREEEELVEQWRALRSKGEKIILYMPTYRDTKVANAEPIDINIKWGELNAFLKAHNSHFVLKLHPIDTTDHGFLKIYDRIMVVKNNVDVYPAFPQVDALITDYSSVFYDFLLMSRPVVFYCYDLKEYQGRHRTLYDDFIKNSPGPMVEEFPQLLEALKGLLDKNSALYKRSLKQVEEAKAQAHQYQDAGSSGRVHDRILERSVT